MIYRLEIPRRAVSNNQFYSGMHWAARKKVADLWHKETVVAARAGEIPKLTKPVNIRVYAVFKSKPQDADNICAKLVIDGLKGVVLVNDDMRYVESVTLIPQTGPIDKVVVFLEEVEDDDCG